MDSRKVEMGFCSSVLSKIREAFAAMGTGDNKLFLKVSLDY